MTLPAPNLDDRRFQDIVDDAKRQISQLCPDWTAHNVSDPGVALIELFAWMTEMTLYRLNQVPDRLYIKFLELVGVELYSAVPASADLVFMLTAPREETVRVPALNQVGTERIGDEEPIVFLTDEELRIDPARLVACLTESAGAVEDHWDDLRLEAKAVRLFTNLAVDDAVYFGFAGPLASHVLRLEMVTGPEGAGVIPSRPPREWEAWDGRQWRSVRILEDTSGGFNQAGRVDLLLPKKHEALALGAHRAYWLRCRLVHPKPDQSSYTKSPELESLSAVTLGGAVRAHHAEMCPSELLGISTGLPGQSFQVRRIPVLPRRAGETVRIVLPRREPGSDQQVQIWREVDDLGEYGPDDRVFTWSGASGEIRFGPRVFDRAGAAHQYGAVPPTDAQIYVTGYRYGGGARGNLPANRLTVAHSSIPFIASVTNLEPSSGGVDAETVENAKLRGPQLLRSARRAVTAHDVERLAYDAAPGVARARCLAPATPDAPARLQIVPRIDVTPQDLKLDQLVVPPDLGEQLRAYLEPRRLLTMRIRIEAPRYQGVKVVAEVQAAPGLRPETVRESTERELYRFINPLVGGPAGTGWPFGVDLTLGDVYGVLNAAFGVAGVRSVRFFQVDLRRESVFDDSDETEQRVTLEPEALFMSFQHRVVVRQ